MTLGSYGLMFILVCNVVYYLFPGACGAKEITKRLNLAAMTSRKWVVQDTCALTGSGISESMEALAKLVREYKGHKS